MRSLIIAAVAVASAFLATSALASPVSEYQLVVDSCTARSSDPYAPPGSSCNATTLDELAATTLAVSAAEASYEYIQSVTDKVNVSISSIGFAEIDIPEGPGIGRLYPASTSGFLCDSTCDLKISASVDGPSILDAVISINTGNDELKFSDGSGYVASDYLGLGGDFTGHFVLVDERSVPEPATLPLVVSACVAAFAFWRQLDSRR